MTTHAAPSTTLAAESVSLTLGSIFRGKVCNAVLANRVAAVYERGSVIYDIGERDRRFFFIQAGVVSVGTVIADGREIIYDLRKRGDVVGELSASGIVRRDRAVALERTEASGVPYTEVLDALQKNQAALEEVLRLFSAALSNAYHQTEILCDRDAVSRVIRVLQKLAAQLGRPTGDLIEIDAYLTQQEISQMVALSREKVSTALNLLRTRNMVRYSRGGRLVVDLKTLPEYEMSPELRPPTAPPTQRV
jgi:CRP/FNR family cyclic AMP-dependent transcriptional regulator